jgi:hypothetical protein
VGEGEVDYKNIEQAPILLSVKARNMEVFHSLKFFQDLRKLQQYKPPGICKLKDRIRGKQVDKEKQRVG